MYLRRLLEMRTDNAGLVALLEDDTQSFIFHSCFICTEAENGRQDLSLHFRSHHKYYNILYLDLVCISLLI